MSPSGGCGPKNLLSGKAGRESRLAYSNSLEVAANWAAILTACPAAVAYARFVGAQWLRRRKLEAHLREEKSACHDHGRRTVVHLMANLAMTEAEVLQAGFQSGKIQVVPGTDDQGRAVRLYFEYSGDDLLRF
jgi:hypothetical protein